MYSDGGRALLLGGDALDTAANGGYGIMIVELRLI